MLTAYATVLAFMLVAATLVSGSLLVARFVRGRRPPTAPESTQDVSDAPESAPHPARFNFDPRFCLVAFVFVVFDVAVAFLVPVAVVLKRWAAESRGTGVRALIEVFAFAGVLLLGLAYARKNGDLEVEATAGGASPPTTVPSDDDPA
jgi:NADH-quinone oxidoreductase subunit A